MDTQVKIRQAVMALLLSSVAACNAQTGHKTGKHVGGPCEGCEAIYEYGNKALTAIDTLPGFHQKEPKLHISGRVFMIDGVRPAADVILYIYHTNREGIYQLDGRESGWSRRHGSIRGWVKTDQDGNYSFYTFRPAAYPDGSEPEHIHMTIKEPGRNEYYLDDYLFEDDPMLTQGIRQRLTNRGGSGVVTPQLVNGMLSVNRDIILGKNIPDYE